MNVLVLSSLFPSSVEPNFGIFVARRARRLAEAGVDVRVVAPVFEAIAPARWASARYRRTLPPPVETLHGLEVHHPRVVHVPGWWQRNPRAMAAACRGVVARLHAQRPFDLVDAHFFFPDGVAAIDVAASLDVPLICTARGSDITALPAHPTARRAVLRVAERAAGLAAVSRSLRDAMVALGMPADKIEVLRNGVDLDAFRPRPDRAACRARFGWTAPTVLSVGALVPLKRHADTVRAVAALPGVHLRIAGQGPERAALQRLIDELGVADRISLLGAQPNAELAALYDAADVSVLASEREGLANVLLEAIACGTPLVATAVDGALEVLDDPRCGTLVPVGDVAALTAALRDELASPRPREAVRASAERFRWAATTEAQRAQMARAIATHAAARR